MIYLYSIVTNDEYEFPIKPDMRIKDVVEFLNTTTSNARKMVVRPRKKQKCKVVFDREVKFDRASYNRKYSKRHNMTRDRTECYR